MKEGLAIRTKEFKTIVSSDFLNGCLKLILNYVDKVFNNLVKIGFIRLQVSLY